MITSYPFIFFMNLIAAAVWIALGSLPREPWRQRIQVALLALAGTSYIATDIGWYDLPGSLLVLLLAAIGVRSYAALGPGWLVHTAGSTSPITWRMHP